MIDAVPPVVATIATSDGLSKLPVSPVHPICSAGLQLKIRYKQNRGTENGRERRALSIVVTSLRKCTREGSIIENEQKHEFTNETYGVRSVEPRGEPARRSVTLLQVLQLHQELVFNDIQMLFIFYVYMHNLLVYSVIY